MAIYAGFLTLAGLFLLGVPVFAAFFGFNIIAALLLTGPQMLSIFSASILDTVTTAELVTVPLFILMGELLFRSGCIAILFDAVDTVPEAGYVATTGGPTRTNVTFFITENHGVVMFDTGNPGWGKIWLAALNVRYRDFQYIVPFLVQFGLYVSPVGFSSSLVPEKWRLLYSLNPMVGVIDGFRWALLVCALRFADERIERAIHADRAVTERLRVERRPEPQHEFPADVAHAVEDAVESQDLARRGRRVVDDPEQGQVLRGDPSPSQQVLPDELLPPQPVVAAGGRHDAGGGRGHHQRRERTDVAGHARACPGLLRRLGGHAPCHAARRPGAHAACGR